jgi:hypothetical protein
MTNDDTDNTDDTDDHDPLESVDDARIDELARSAGNELRRPAPEHGLAGVQRTRRNRQITRAAIGSTAVVALVVGGFVTANRGDDAPRIETADSVATISGTDTTTQPVTTTEAGTTTPIEPVATGEPAGSVPEDPAPASSTPATDPPSDSNAPSIVYTSTESFPPDDGIQTLIDPRDGTVIGTGPIDQDASRIAQEPFGVRDRSNVNLGAVSYEFREVAFDSGTLTTEFFPDVDLCEQNTVTVTSPNGSSLPERARALLVSPDDRHVITLSAECPEEGTMGADAVGTQLPYDLTLQVFDAQRPELPGRNLAVIPSSAQPSTLTSSGGGGYVSISTFADSAAYRVFDIDTATEVDLGLDVGSGCNVTGTRYSRFIGPWIGASSIAVTVGCVSTSTLHVIDLADPASQLTVPFPSSTEGGFVSFEVDYTTYRAPQNAWFTMCNATTFECWIGRGSEPVIELPGVAQASFLPLGFSYGG